MAEQLDGAFAPEADGTLRFRRLSLPTDLDVARLMTTVARPHRAAAHPARPGRGYRGDRAAAAEAVALAGFASAVGREYGRHPVTSPPVLATGLRIEYL